MTVHALKEKLSLTVFWEGDGQREVTGAYAGDVLSRAMSRCREGDCWVTVRSHKTVAAIALMTDCALVLLCEGEQPDPDMLEAFKSRGMNLMGSGEDAFLLCRALGELLPETETV